MKLFEKIAQYYVDLGIRYGRTLKSVSVYLLSMFCICSNLNRLI